eukprot:jgi/Undpi1/9605/HiC_scaffold_27.g12061.m1
MTDSTLESVWELPPSAREVVVAPADAASSPLVAWQDASSNWTQVLDEATNTHYFFNREDVHPPELELDVQALDEAMNNTHKLFNTSTRESVWELGENERLASGISAYTAATAAAAAAAAGGSDSGEDPRHEHSTHEQEEDDSSKTSWQDQVLGDFQVPETVSEAVGRAGSAHVWPLTSDGGPSRLERWDVLKAADPYREHFCTGSAWRQEHPEFEPKLSFYAFDTAVEHVERYWTEEAEAPFRCRLQRSGLKFSRDIAKWEKRAPVKKKKTGTTKKLGNGAGWAEDQAAGGKRTGGRAGTKHGVVGEGGGGGDSAGGSGGGGGDGGGGDGGGGGGGGVGGDGARFFAFPLVVNNSHAHHVDWTSGPDRYQITQRPEPEWGWSRLFTFFAYAASKYHVLETTEAPLAQKVVKGQFLTPEKGWKCVLAFFAFDADVPGSNRYYVEEQDDPHLRTRIGLESSCRWEARHQFAAFDVPVPGSCPLDVHYTISSADSLSPYPAQCRISLKDPWGPWEQKFRFYAFPAEYTLLAPAQEELDALSASLDDTTSSAGGAG